MGDLAIPCHERRTVTVDLRGYDGRLPEQQLRGSTLVRMRLRNWLFLIFLIVPVIEIGLFYLVGQWIGIWPTLALVILTAVIGSWLVAHQGRETWARLNAQIANGESPSATLVHGAMILVAGALLLTPGFLTDAIGFTLLFPPAREGLRGWFVKRMMSRWVVVR